MLASSAARKTNHKPSKRKKREARRSFRKGTYKPKVYPSTYHALTNPIVYEGTPQDRDTSDRHMVKEGQQAGFDPLGFLNGLGMQKDMFYYCPYLSCLNCNTILFLDANKLRAGLNQHLIPVPVAEEVLPPCNGCGRTDTLMVGADDTSEAMKETREAMIRKLRMEKAAARVIQQAYRRSLYLRHGRALRDSVKMYSAMQSRLASIIQSLYRMRLAQRRLRIEKELLLIKGAHPIVFKWCLTTANQNSPIRVFWYNSPVMVRQLYEDYWILLERTGFRPKRFVVEDNIHEIAQRVLARIAWYVVKIQKVWRGLLTRRYIKVYARECTWIREQEVTAAIKAQRCFRGFLERETMWRLRDNRQRKAVKEKVVVEVKQEREQRVVKAMDLQLMKEYQKERAKENSMRRLGRTDVKGHGGNKMVAYADSMYGGDEVKVKMEECLGMLRLMQERAAAKEQSKAERIDWVRKRQGDDKYLHVYYEPELRAAKQELIDKLQKEVGYKKSFKQRVIKEFHSKGHKFVYPPGLNDDKRAILHTDIDAMFNDNLNNNNNNDE